jgi:hypothetical protein
MGDLKELFTRVLDAPTPPMTPSRELLASAHAAARHRRMWRAGSLLTVTALVVVLAVALVPTLVDPRGAHRGSGSGASPVLSESAMAERSEAAVPETDPSGSVCRARAMVGNPAALCTRLDPCPRFTRNSDWCEIVSGYQLTRAMDLRSALISRVPAEYPTYIVIPTEAALGPRALTSRGGDVHRIAAIKLRRGDDVSYVVATVWLGRSSGLPPGGNPCLAWPREAVWMKQVGCRVVTTKGVRVGYSWGPAAEASQVYLAGAFVSSGTFVVAEWSAGAPLLSDRQLAELAAGIEYVPTASGG